LTREEYFKYRLSLLGMAIFWLGCIIIAIFLWNGLNIIIKGFLTVLGLFFSP
jgi:hypothetical protein